MPMNPRLKIVAALGVLCLSLGSIWIGLRPNNEEEKAWSQERIPTLEELGQAELSQQVVAQVRMSLLRLVYGPGAPKDWRSLSESRQILWVAYQAPEQLASYGCLRYIACESSQPTLPTLAECANMYRALGEIATAEACLAVIAGGDAAQCDALVRSRREQLDTARHDYLKQHAHEAGSL